MQPSDPLLQSAQYLKGVGPERAAQLRRLGIDTIRDALFHFPRTYEDLSNVRPIASLVEGEFQTAEGDVVEMEGRQLASGKTLVQVVIADGNHCLAGVWFNQPYAARRFRYGQRLIFSGKAKWYRDHWQMNSPRVQDAEASQANSRQGILPVYPLTEELRADHLRRIIHAAVREYGHHLVDILPDALRRQHQFPDIGQALRDIHMPAHLPDAQVARRRFVYEEFLALQVALAARRRELRDRLRAPILIVTEAVDRHIRRRFPFTLTEDQDRAIADICRDLAGQRPMQRLLQADVGAGKTAVAAYALLAAVANKNQGALMAPTEVLAFQHWRTLQRYLATSKVRCLLLTGALGGRDRQSALDAIRAGDIDLVVGTQALLEKDVQFARLGLVVVDEQHRFGVNQRARVRQLGTDPHYLVMTATPIPRTVALTLFGDLDVSVIRQLPPGRQPVVTRWISERQRQQVYTRVRGELDEGRQAYVVCPLVTESENLDVKAALQTFAELEAGPFHGYRLGLLHGRLDEEIKNEVMQRFAAAEIDLLVTTTVIEVGVDVPNATVMIIEHADRFGLSQLHQLRGRVSRGSVAGECYLFAEDAAEDAKRRLRILTRTNDGFLLAEEDVRLRGFGELFGVRQHGWGEIRMGDLVADGDLLRLARRDAIALIVEDGGLQRPEHLLLRQAVLSRYGQTLDLATIG